MFRKPTLYKSEFLADLVALVDVLPVVVRGLFLAHEAADRADTRDVLLSRSARIRQPVLEVFLQLLHVLT